MIHTDHSDPAFRYEGLARIAFDGCGKWKDPFGYAAQEVYVNFMETISLRGKRALSTVLIKLIIDHQEKNYVDQLKKLEDSIWQSKTQDDIVEIIDETIQVLKQLK